MLGDEFTPDGCRLWDLATQEKLDKDRFRRDLGGVIEKYQEARDTPVYWEAAPQDGEQVHVEFLDNTGKAICSSESFQSGSVKPAASSEDLDSEPPILEYRELIRTAPPPDHPNTPGFKIGKTL